MPDLNLCNSLIYQDKYITSIVLAYDPEDEDIDDLDNLEDDDEEEDDDDDDDEFFLDDDEDDDSYEDEDDDDDDEDEDSVDSDTED